MLNADLKRLWKSTAFRVSLIAMLVIASGLTYMQATAMDYTVPLSRVIFLPLSMYGVVMAAFVSIFTGSDFSDGFIRNKMIASGNRNSIVFSHILVSCIACVITYLVVTAFTTGVGSFFFENNIIGGEFVWLFLLGLGMSLTFGCLFSVITLLSGSKTRAIVICMGLAFVLLFLSLHANDVLVHQDVKDGFYSLIHDINPYGQAAQISAWEVWHPVRGLLIDLLLILGLPTLGCLLFRRKDIN